MSQDFDEVTLGTQITVGLNRLLARDLTALTKSSSQTTYPMSPIDGQLFCHTGNQEMNIRLGTSWTRIWGWKNDLPPFTANQLEANFQTLSDELTNISERGEQPFAFLASPYIPFNLTTSLEIFDCSTDSDMRSYLQIGQLGTSGGAQISGSQIQDGTIGAEKFAFDFNTDIPRAMTSGDIKWTFNPSYDRSRFLLCDGKTIGGNQSNANYKGETYYNLFRALGGSDSDWATGKTVALPDVTGDKTFVAHGEVPNYIFTCTNFNMSLRATSLSGWGDNVMQFTSSGEGNVLIELIGGGGGAADLGGSLKCGGGGAGWFKGIFGVSYGDSIRIKVGSCGETNKSKFVSPDVIEYRGSSGEESSLELNSVTLVKTLGGKGSAITLGTKGFMSVSIGKGGKVEVGDLSGFSEFSYKEGFSGKYPEGTGGCCGHGGQSDGSRYYAGNELFVYPPDFPGVCVGSGCEARTNISDVSEGFAYVYDLDGVLQRSGGSSETTKSVEVINALCLIKV